jgi:hypothetical protein
MIGTYRTSSGLDHSVKGIIHTVWIKDSDISDASLQSDFRIGGTS